MIFWDKLARYSRTYCIYFKELLKKYVGILFLTKTGITYVIFVLAIIRFFFYYENHSENYAI